MSAPSPVIIAVDAGTTAIKAVAFDGKGREVVSATLPNTVLRGPGGHFEQNMEQTWIRVVSAVRQLVTRNPELPQRALALALTGQADGTWLVDGDSQPVGPALLWLDGRSAGVLERLQQSGQAQRVASITRTALNTSQQGVQLRWLAEHEPERLARSAWALHCKDWLYLCCTGLARTDWAEGIYTFGNPHTLAYDATVIGELGLDDYRRLLPELEDGLRAHAPLTATAAAACGLRCGLPVVLAPLDVACATLGAGQLANGHEQGVSVLGSAGIHTRLHGDLAALPASPGYLWPLASTGLFQAARSQMAAALNIDWFAGILADAGALLGAPELSPDALLERIESAALKAPAGAAIYHPFIADSGERSPVLAPRARAQFSGLSQSTNLAGLCRAVYEGLAFSARDAYETMGTIPDEICLVGGPARSALLRQTFANVLQRPIRLTRRQEVGAAGAAMVASVALGVHPDLPSVARHWHEDAAADLRVLPEDAAAGYDRLFNAYRHGYQHASPFWDALHQARQP